MDNNYRILSSLSEKDIITIQDLLLTHSNELLTNTQLLDNYIQDNLIYNKVMNVEFNDVMQYVDNISRLQPYVTTLMMVLVKLRKKDER